MEKLIGYRKPREAQYRPSKKDYGGSKPKRKTVYWVRSKPGCILKYVAQYILEPEDDSRNFGGIEQCRPIVQFALTQPYFASWIKKNFNPPYYGVGDEKNLIDGQGSCEYVMYHRAYKVLYDNTGSRKDKSRGGRGKEHYERDPRLIAVKKEAEEFLHQMKKWKPRKLLG